MSLSLQLSHVWNGKSYPLIPFRGLPTFFQKNPSKFAASSENFTPHDLLSANKSETCASTRPPSKQQAGIQSRQPTAATTIYKVVWTERGPLCYTFFAPYQVLFYSRCPPLFPHFTWIPNWFATTFLEGRLYPGSTRKTLSRLGWCIRTTHTAIYLAPSIAVKVSS